MSSEKIETLNKPYQPQGLEKVMYPKERLYNKQKNLLNLYKPIDIQAENVKKVGPHRPPKSFISLDPISDNVRLKKRGKPPKNPIS